MSYIIDRLILIATSILIFAKQGSITEIIVIGLIAVFISGMSYYLEDKKMVFGICMVYFLCTIYYHELIFISPVVMYDLYGRKSYIEMGVLIILNAVSFDRIDNISVIVILLIIIMELLACILHYKSKKIELLQNKNIHIRDDSEERNLLLAEKNRHLIEKQDQEVYVATLKERNRIAREIHDNVGHMITRSILQMGALMTINKEEPLHGQLESVKNNLDVAMNNIRESVHDLHDESVDLRQTLTELISELDNKFECKFEYDAGKDIDRKYKYAIIGIVKEAVSNIIKHSKNKKVDIILREHPGMLQLIIHDYSENILSEEKNIEYIKSKSDGIGIGNMQDRVFALKGNISIDTKNGFKIFVTLPKI